ncbi:glycosyltransferase [Costertonia aggregata]|uniref:Glycosyltransferase family 4 protein n=1 Tax=Costertonia aggregata TaxID=343403 RepID=A0A7H9AU78_9FLAO|nr:glycosyltransferase [Costertonia aggregata]QLG47009.1 glycosyltransferase family 4 protein [Costertonia aggregata]
MSGSAEKQGIILIIGLVWPEPSTTAAGSRMMQLIRFFLKNDYRIVFASTTSESEQSADLVSIGVEKATIQLNDTSFDIFVKDINPTIVLFDRFLTEEQFGWRVMENAPNAIRILDSEDLHSLRNTREKAHKCNISFSIDDWKQNSLTKREIASIYRCDATLIISSFEMELLQNELQLDKNLIWYLPFLLESIDHRDWEGFEDRTDFICIGNGKHAPNVDAVEYLYEKIWPLIKKNLPNTNVHIYGAYLPKRIQQLHDPKAGFLVKGWADDAQIVFAKAKINLAPLRFGAGIKGKLTDSMRYGTPSITTSIGAEGMHLDLPWNGSINDVTTEFADAAVQLYQNREKWQIAQQNGLKILQQVYNAKDLEANLLNRITALQKNLDNHRSQNFIGGMLAQHTVMASKYLSKWITEKNRRE